MTQDTPRIPPRTYMVHKGKAYLKDVKTDSLWSAPLDCKTDLPIWQDVCEVELTAMVDPESLERDEIETVLTLLTQ